MCAVFWPILDICRVFTVNNWDIFSERELMFRFAICYRRSVCRLSVTLVRLYSAAWNFRQSNDADSRKDVPFTDLFTLLPI